MLMSNCLGCHKYRRDLSIAVRPLVDLLHTQLAWVDVEAITKAIAIVKKQSDDMLWEHEHLFHDWHNQTAPEACEITD